MVKSILDIVAGLTDHPLKQAALAAFCTFIFEDPTTVGCGLLVADGQMNFWTAMAGLTVGITVGDMGLYVIGRFFGPWIDRRKLISKESMERAKLMVDDNLVVAVLLSRFLPGTRIPTFVGAGMFKASALKFLLVAIVASLLWTFCLLTLTRKIGEAVLPLLGELKWVILLAILGIVLVTRVVRRRRLKAREKLHGDGEPVVSLFEFWPPILFYLPVGLYYTWLAIRYRSVSLPSLANPSIYSGGICRESKSQILSLVPEKHAHLLAAHTTFEKRAGEDDPMPRLREAMNRAGLRFPIVAKPDEGHRGAGVRLIADEAELRAYIQDFPPEVPVLLQKLADHQAEAGVFYYRMPSEKTGRLLSLTLKDLPTVTGDGKRTLRELILADPRARHIAEVYFRRHKAMLDTILEPDRAYNLIFTGNHCQGAIFRDGTPLITEDLRRAISQIADDIPEFYFGRFDLKFRDLESFLRGENFEIVEINGASSEATHIWDAKTKLSDAYRTLFEQFRLAFEIGHANRQRGFKPIGGTTILKDVIRYHYVSKKYPASS